MYLAAFLPASLAALSMAGAAAAVQCSEHTECTHYTGCGVDFRFPPGCGDGSSGSWGVRGEFCGHVDCDCETGQTMIVYTDCL